jgi:hypothetical protein
MVASFSRQNIGMNPIMMSPQDAKHIFPVFISCLTMCLAKVAAHPLLRYERAQWMQTCSSGKSDTASEIYSSQDVRKACPCTQSPLKLLGMPGLILKVCEMLRTVVTSGAGAGDSVATFLATSMLLMIEKGCVSVLFVEQVASACSDNHFLILWVGRCPL